MQYDFNFGPNGSQRIEVQGRFFKYAEGTGKIKVTLDGGRAIELVPGQGVYGEKFSGLSIVDKSGFSNSGMMLAGDFDFRDDTMQALVQGEVEILPSDLKRIFEGKHFMGTWRSSGGSGFQMVSVENPAGSDKNVLVSAMNVASNAGAFVEAYLMPILSEAQAPTVTAAKSASNMRGATGVSDLSAAKLTARNTATQPGPMPAPIWRQQSGSGSPTYVPLHIDPSEPLIVRPGIALVVQCMTISNDMTANVRFREEAI